MVNLNWSRVAWHFLIIIGEICGSVRMEKILLPFFLLPLLLLLQQPRQAASRVLEYQTNAQWLEWKRRYDKSYESDLSELERYVTWVSNKALVESHNHLASDFGYALALNQFADLVSQD